MTNYDIATSLVKELFEKHKKECTQQQDAEYARRVYAHATLGTLQACIMISMGEFPETVAFWQKELEKLKA